MSWTSDFMAKTPQERITEIGEVNDLLRTLRSMTLAAMNAQNAIELSERNFAGNWQNTLIADIDAGTDGQEPGLESYAQDLQNRFTT